MPYAVINKIPMHEARGIVAAGRAPALPDGGAQLIERFTALRRDIVAVVAC